MSRELFSAGRAWLGHLRGGLAMASVAACGGFAAINGSSVATAATMAQVALPEMRRAGYHPAWPPAWSRPAARWHHGPAAVILVLYGIMTETDIRKLFAAGVIPGLMAVAFYFAVVQTIARLRPDAMPRGEPHGWAERFATLRGRGR
jgi:TRAP-type C4-dicarboxylate transport system permease large subunit